MSAGRARHTTGYVVKVEEKVPHPKGGFVTVRREVSRVYHSRDAAEACLNLFKRTHPNSIYYVHTKGAYGLDGLPIH